MSNERHSNNLPIIYRAALLTQGQVIYKRGNLARVLKWAQGQTAELAPGRFRLTITPVTYLLPWEKEKGEGWE